MACKLLSTLFLVCFLVSTSFAQAKIDPTSNSEEIKSETKEIDHVANEARLRSLIPKQVITAEQLETYRSEVEAQISKGTRTERAYSILTAYYYHCEFLFNGKEIKKANGQWYQFKDDFTYEYGVFEEVKGQGKYLFNINNMQLTILDDHKKKLPEVFEVKFKDEMMLWIAKDVYQNNPKQIKMTQKFAKPAHVLN